jgi:hypothetical protein
MRALRHPHTSYQAPSPAPTPPHQKTGNKIDDNSKISFLTKHTHQALHKEMRALFNFVLFVCALLLIFL